MEINVLHQQIEDVEYMAEHGKSVPQVIERWLVQRGIALIPKSTTPERIVQNADIWDLVWLTARWRLCAL